MYPRLHGTVRARPPTSHAILAPQSMAPWDFLFDESQYVVGKNGVSPIQNMGAYLGGSAIQTVGDNPVTAYRQLVQQYAKNLAGETVAPAIAAAEANAVFRATPLTACMSGLWPRLIGVLFKRIPKFGVLLGYTFLTGDDEPGYAAATAASILSAPFINPVRMVEKQQRAFLKQTGVEKPIMEILKEASAKYFAPLFRGTIPLMGHSFASAILGLVGQPKLQKYIQAELGKTGQFGGSATNLVASAIVSPIYVVVTNPLSRLEVIMQTNSIKGKSINVFEALRELSADMAKFGLSGIFRGQGIGIFKAIISLTLFHEGRLFITRQFKAYNIRTGRFPPPAAPA
jgi:hypothetical protein